MVIMALIMCVIISRFCNSSRKTDADLWMALLHALDHAPLRADVFLSGGDGRIWPSGAGRLWGDFTLFLDARVVAGVSGIDGAELCVDVCAGHGDRLRCVCCLGACMILMALLVRLPIKWLARLVWR